MQEALPYKTWQPIPHQPFLTRSPKPSPIPIDTKSVNPNGSISIGSVTNMVSENAVIVFGKSGCCMSHVVKRLLQGLGVNPVVFGIEESDENVVVKELETVVGEQGERRLQFPAVFIGGELFGGLDRIMATHITGELVPVLKKAGALWL